MDDSAREFTTEAFAELTVLLEDVTALAVDGQSRDQSIERTRANIVQMRSLLSASLERLSLVELYIEERNRQ
jgi:hypothetical protein